MTASDEIAVAQKICLEAHAGQVRKFSDEDYACHPQRVACTVEQGQRNLPAVALMHDVLEDTDYTVPMMLEAGIARTTAGLVIALTRKDGETYYAYINRVCTNPDAIKVKLADLADNMRDLKEGSLKDKYRLAYHVLSGGAQPD